LELRFRKFWVRDIAGIAEYNGSLWVKKVWTLAGLGVTKR